MPLPLPVGDKVDCGDENQAADGGGLEQERGRGLAVLLRLEERPAEVLGKDDCDNGARRGLGYKRSRPVAGRGGKEPLWGCAWLGRDRLQVRLRAEPVHIGSSMPTRSLAVLHSPL